MMFLPHLDERLRDIDLAAMRRADLTDPETARSIVDRLIVEVQETRADEGESEVVCPTCDEHFTI